MRYVWRNAASLPTPGFFLLCLVRNATKLSPPVVTAYQRLHAVLLSWEVIPGERCASWWGRVLRVSGVRFLAWSQERLLLWVPLSTPLSFSNACDLAGDLRHPSFRFFKRAGLCIAS